MAPPKGFNVKWYRLAASTFIGCSFALVIRSIIIATWRSNQLSTSTKTPGNRISHIEDKPLLDETTSQGHGVAPVLQQNRNFDSNQVLDRQGHRKQHQLLLNVPFYVYEDIARLSDTFLGGIPVEQAISQRWQKHSLDYWFAQSSLYHPMRTHDPSQAKLFVIPLLMNLYSLRVYSPSSPVNAHRNVTQSRNVTLCWNIANDNKDKGVLQKEELCDKAMLKYATNVLNESAWFHRNQGRDHIVVTSHFGYKLKGKLNMPPLLRKIIASCNAVSYENRKYNIGSRQSYPSLLVGNPCPLLDQQERHHQTQPLRSTQIKKTHQVAFIGNLLDPGGKFYEDRANICRWINETNIHSLSTSYYQQEEGEPLPIVSTCGRGSQCPTLRLAKYGFHVKGDTFGSQRLMDALLSGTVPLFTRIEQYEIVPPWINWTKLSYFVNVSNQQSFQSTLSRLLYNTSNEEYYDRLDGVLANRDLFDWKTSLVPFDTYMYMLQAHLYPETKHPQNRTNRYSALILP